jgi:hypothetical protein
MNSGPFIVYTDTNGIGWCRESEDNCPQYDGKRCRLTGCRPSGICEPWAIAAAKRVAELEEAVRSLARLWPAERWATLSGICRDHPLIDEIANLKKGGA